MEPTFAQLLLELIARVIDAPVLAVGVRWSSDDVGRQDSAQDVTLFAVCSVSDRQRRRIIAFGRTIVIVAESAQSIAAELETPKRPAIIRLLADAHVLYDRGNLLKGAVERSRWLLERRAPRSAYRSEAALFEDARDALKHLRTARRPQRILVRAALLQSVVELAYLRAGCWPAPLHRAVEVLTAHDAACAAQVVRALVGDDGELDAVVTELLAASDSTHLHASMPAPAAARVPPRSPQAVEPPKDIRSLHPPALARLPVASIASISTNDLQCMSRLQLLTVQRVHGATLSEPQLRCISAVLQR